MSTDNSSCRKPNSVNPVNSFSSFLIICAVLQCQNFVAYKLDNLAAECVTYNPDIVCIVESWLSDDILDNEI